MDQIQQKCWSIYNNDQVSQKDKLLSVMALNSLQERVEKIESNNEFR